jgi:hypothetical protein
MLLVAFGLTDWKVYKDPVAEFERVKFPVIELFPEDINPPPPLTLNSSVLAIVEAPQ